MIEIEIFTTKWDKYYNQLVGEIEKVLGECGIQTEIKTLDIEYEDNERILERHIQELERKFAAIENPVKAVPLVVVNGKPFSVGISPTFAKKFKTHIEEECGMSGSS